ncbi:hypothetical protein CLU96_0644 [Chryseobacterium sp. 52]|nr:hypothetical protein CLU96_0644 [Chryseobacterium sp. 52]
MQNNNYEAGDKTLFDERQGCFDEDLFLAEKKDKKNRKRLLPMGLY